jgi:hypothetical protein
MPRLVNRREERCEPKHPNRDCGHRCIDHRFFWLSVLFELDSYYRASSHSDTRADPEPEHNGEAVTSGPGKERWDITSTKAAIFSASKSARVYARLRNGQVRADVSSSAQK